MNKYLNILLIGSLILPLASCKDDDGPVENESIRENEYIGKAVGNFSADEWYPGGELGTTDNVQSGCYEDETPAVTDQGLFTAFQNGEASFERNFTVDTKPFSGLGPAYLRSSCLDCHPGYGHGKRQSSYPSKFGNGYLLAIYHPTEPGSNDGSYISEVTGMPQTNASSPFKAPLDGDKVSIVWTSVTTMESGLPMEFKDGEAYELIYPTVTIPTDAFNTSPQPDNIEVRLESTIGIIGTGVIDAIPQDSIIAQYRKEAQFVELNPQFWDKEAGDMAASAWYSLTTPGRYADGTQTTASDKLLKRYTYALTRATLQDGPGANAIWNITNVSRSDRHFLYSTKAWAKAMSENPEVIAAIKANPQSPYYADGTDEGIAEAVYALLNPATDQFDNVYHNFTPEMDDDTYYNFLVWHRGLAIPRARNLQDKDVQRGKELFLAMGCANCHRPTWHTESDNYWAPQSIGDRELPRYANQTIHPYSDFIQHRLFMKNDIHGSWCRTTPLWGRGLSFSNTGAEDRLHDCRARNEVEAIMWHAYSKKSDAYDSALQFYNLSKEDRDAVVKFIRSI